MDIYIVRSVIQFKNPIIGQPTRHVAEHYNGRRITASVGSVEQLFRFTKDELVFDVTEEDMIAAIEARLSAEQ